MRQLGSFSQSKYLNFKQVFSREFIPIIDQLLLLIIVIDWKFLIIFILIFRPGQSKDDIGPFKTMAAGAVGGAALWTAIFPADVIKSRVQIQGLSASMLSVGMDIVKKDGVLALYNGLMPSVCRTIPATAVLFVVYEYTKKFMNQMLDWLNFDIFVIK